jgi:hypothetical protein
LVIVCQQLVVYKYCCSIAIAPRIYFSNINCEDLNPEITSIIDVSRIPQKLIETELNIIAKASFGLEMLTLHHPKKFTLKKLNMNKEETLEQLRDIIKPYINSEEGFENFTENTDFISDLNINSANLVDIILDVEPF